VLYFIEEKLIQVIAELKKWRVSGAVGVRFFYSLLKIRDMASFGGRQILARLREDPLFNILNLCQICFGYLEPRYALVIWNLPREQPILQALAHCDYF